MRYIIKAFDGQTADSALIDVTQYANELAGKAGRSLSNLTDAGKSFSFPSGTYVNIPITNNTSMSYTAPADGWVTAQMSDLPSGYGYIMVSCNRIMSTGVTTGTSAFSASVPARKGSTVTIRAVDKTILNAYFIYANGEVPN